MCAIAGFVFKFKNYINDKTICNVLSSMEDRGPDGTSWLSRGSDGKLKWNEKKYLIKDRLIDLGLGCSRLALQDISDKGLQPIKSNNKKIWVVLNGEIFNFIEIKQKLSQKGYFFKTGTDTEVIANSYQEWGKKCFKFFNGQFAIAIYDMIEDRFIIARDRIGIVPLYYKFEKNSFIFSSQLKGIKAFKNKVISLNKNKISHILGLPYKLHSMNNDTLLRDVFSLEPGSYIEININDLKYFKYKYWDINSIQENKIYNYVCYKEKIKNLLINSVKIRLRTDRKYAFLLSGGIDSSAILGIAKNYLGIDPITFSLDLPDERFNENDSIKNVLLFNNLEENFIQINPKKIMETILLKVQTFDEPLPTPNCILHTILANEINKSGSKVVLNGVGGDEVFLGYHDHFLYHLATLFNTNSVKFQHELNLWSINQKRDKSVFYSFLKYLNTYKSMINPDFLSRSAGFNYLDILKNHSDDKLRNYLNEFKNEYKAKDKQINDIKYLTIPHSVKMDDKCYLQYSVEARQPFLDHRLIELGLKIPHFYKIKKGINKFILRQSVAEFIPNETKRDLNKIGLNLPIDKWFNNELKDWVNDLLNKKEDKIFEFLDFNAVQKMLIQHRKQEFNHSLKIWDICCIQSWLKSFG